MSFGPAAGNPLEKFRPIVSAQVRAGMAWLRERELSQQQAFVLDYLSRHPGSIQREIATASGTTAANVSGVVRGLEARGLVTREFGDERSKCVYASASGIALISGHETAMAAVDQGLLAALSDSEKAQLAALLDKVIAGIEGPQATTWTGVQSEVDPPT